MNIDYDVIIIGAGPNGLYMSYQLKKNNISYLCLEKGDLLNNIKKYPNILWHSEIKYLKFPSKQNEKLVNNEAIYDNNFIVNYYINFLNEHNLNIKTYCNVIDIKKKNENYEIYYINNNNKYIITSKFVIIATGIYNNNNKLSINTNYNFCYNNLDNFNYKNEKICIVGSGNSSIDYITYLLPNNNIFWIIRGKKYNERLNTIHHKNFKEIISKHKDNLKIFYENTIVNIDNDKNVTLSNKEVLNVDKVILLLGMHMKSKFFEKIGIKYKGDYVSINDNNETNLKNIYVFGSVASQHNKMIYIHNGNPDIFMKILNNIKSN